MASCSPPPLSVLYEDVDERVELENSFEDSLVGPEPNAFYLPGLDSGVPVRFSDLSKHFPLKGYDSDANFIFRVQSKGNTFLDLTNPAQAVPRLGPNGAIVMKVFRSPHPLKAVSQQEISLELSAPLPKSYFDYEKRLEGSAKPEKVPHMVGGLKQETIDEGIMAA